MTQLVAVPRESEVARARGLEAGLSRVVAIAAIILTGLSALPASAVKPDPPDVAPEKVVSSFYALCIREQVTGLPTDEQFEAMREMLSDNILGMLADARMEQADFSRENPDEKPPWIEGDLFSSLFEGPSRFSVGAAVIDGNRATITVDFAYDGTPDDRPFEWKDDVILVIDVNNEWKIDDIEYRGDWDFASRGRLSEALGSDQPE